MTKKNTFINIMFVTCALSAVGCIIYSRMEQLNSFRQEFASATRSFVSQRMRIGIEGDIGRTVYLITPTFTRPSQYPDLTRMAQTVMAAGKGLHWLVIEDAAENTDIVRGILQRNMPYNHTLMHCRPQKRDEAYFKNLRSRLKYNGLSTPGKGVCNRNTGLQWLLDQNITDGVIYFADDDNSYDIRLFEEIRTTKKIAVFPAGHFNKVALSTPVVKDGKVTAFVDIWLPRKWPIDMATFAVNVGFWRERGAPMLVDWLGYIETGWFQDLNATFGDLEPKADNATKVLVWHTKTVESTPVISYLNKDVAKYPDTNIAKLRDIVGQTIRKT